jgi:creatinine amidohydrolase
LPRPDVHPWEDLTTVELAALAGDAAVAVLPVAAVEQHGPHLPLGTDAVIVDAIVDTALHRCAEGGPVLRLPSQRVGLSPEHAAFAGTLSFDAETVLASWTAIGVSVARAGVRRLVIVNGHGGQGALVDVAAQRLRCQAALLVARCSYYRFPLPDGWLTAHEQRYGLHGGLVETSLMLAISPAAVRTGHVATFPSAAEGWERDHPGLEVEGESGLAWQAEDLNPAGVTGDAAAATAEFGARLLDYYAGRLAAVIDAVQAAALPPAAGGTSSR